MVTGPWRYKVTGDSCCVELYIFDISDPNNLQNKTKDHRSCVIRARDSKGHASWSRDLDVQGHAW